MKRLLPLLLALPAGLSQAQGLTNDGATLTVAPGTSLSIDGALLNRPGSTLTNDGTVRLAGDLTNTGTLNSAGTLVFAGATNQAFAPGTATVARLTLASSGPAGQNTLQLTADLTVGQALLLQQGLLRTAPTATLTLPAGAQLSGETSGRYVQGNLRVERAAANGPIGFDNGVTLDGTGLGPVAVTRTAGLQMADLSYGTNPANASLRGIDRIWTIEPAVPPTAAVPLTLEWLADDDNGLNSFDQLQAWQAAPASTAWRAASSVLPATVSGSRRSFSFSSTALGRLTISGAAAPLPVELTVFTARAQAGQALLEWRTASETNSAYFEVQRSDDARTFRPLGQVPGQGTSTTPRAYAWTDATPGPALRYYRLRQVDADGTARFSPVRSLLLETAPAELALFPNPTTGAATLLGATPGTRVTVFDALGRQVLAATADAAGQAYLLLPPGTPTGVYVVRCGAQARRLVVR